MKLNLYFCLCLVAAFVESFGIHFDRPGFFPQNEHERPHYFEKSHRESIKHFQRVENSKLIGEKDGHDTPDKKLIGQPDGHDGPLIGQKDGHDKPSIGKQDGHEKPFLGHNVRPNKPLIGQPDGHDKPVIGQPDGHDKPISGQHNGHDKPLIGKPDGHDKPLISEHGVHDDDLIDNMEWNYEEYEEGGDESLVRCKRPLCESSMSCPMGPQIDANGCPTCHCLEDPCLEEKCETGHSCRPMVCPRQGACKKLQTKCEKKKCDGPEPMCATYCPMGYKLNDRGCMTCVCRDFNTFPTEESSLAEDEDENEEDDEYYEEDDDDSLIIEDLDEHLREDDDDEEEEDQNDDEEESNVEQGEKCEATNCRKNEICKADWRYPGDSETEKTNRICMIKTRCWAVVNEPFLYPDHRNPDRRQSCDASLTFEPLQCLGYNPNVKDQPKTCWCTNDLGHMIEGTKTSIYAEEQKPICERNTTISATVSMKFKITGLGSRGKTIVEVLTREISKTTFAPKGVLKIISVEYPIKPEQKDFVMATLILSNHPDYDLPYALDLIFNLKDMVLIFDLYTVILAEKPEATHYQFSSPAPPIMEDEDDTDVIIKFEPLPYLPESHPIEYSGMGSGLSRSLVIVCLIVLSVLIIIVISIIGIMAHRNCRRGHIRHHQLQNQISVAIDPEQLLGDPRKNESVVLVTDDVLSKVKDLNLA